MKQSGLRSVAIAAVFGLGWVGLASGTQYFTDVGGPLAWDTATANWADASGGPYTGTWASGDAVFEGTAGTVSVGTVSANSLAFNVAGYTLTGGVVTLTGPLIVASNNAAINSFIAGSAGLTKSGTNGTLTLGGTNTYSGGTTVSGGTLAVSADNQLGAASGGITLAGGTLRVNGTLNTITRPLTLGAGGGTISLGTWLNYNGAITGGSGLFVSGSDFILGPPSANNIGTITMSGSRLFINNANAIANNVIIVITNSAKLALQGTAPTVPQNPITFANGCGFCSRLNGIVISTTNAVFPASGTFVLNNDDAVTYGMQVVGNWPTLTGAMNFQVGGGNATVGAVTMSATLSGAYGVTKSNPGVLVLAASNSITGGLIVDSGTVKLGNECGLGVTNGLTVKNGAKLDLAGYSPKITGLSDTIAMGALGTALVTNTGAEATLTILRASQTFGGTIAGPINLVIPAGGSGYQILSGTNSYTGLTTVYSALEAWSTNALGATSAGTILTNGSTLVLKGTSNPMTYAPEPLTVYNSSYLGLNVDATLRDAVWTGPVTLAPGATLNVQLQGANTSSVTIVSAITGAGAIAKADAKLTLKLSGTNDYGGGTTLGAGSLILGSATGLGTGPVTLTSGLLDLNGNGAVIGSLSGGANSVIVDFSAGTGTTNTLTVNQTIAGNMLGSVSNGLNKTLSFVKSGNAVLTLSNTNTFQGPVTINGGTLRLGVAAALTGNVATVTVNSGGTLDLYSQSLNNNSRTVVIAGPGASGQSGALVNTANGAEAQVYNLTLADDATIGSTGNKLNVYGTLNGGGHVLTVAGTGEINIRPNNGFANLAGITINSGLFRLESNQGWTGTYTVNAGGKLDTYGTPRLEAGSVNLNGGRLVNGGTGAMPATWTGAISLTGTCVVDTVGGNMILSNAVTGAGALTKISTNTLTLAGACSFGDALSVSNGMVTLNGSMSHANMTVANGATLNGSGTVHARVVNGAADKTVVNGTLNLTGLTLDLDVTGSLIGKGPFTLVDATDGTLVGRFAAVLDVPAGHSVAYTGTKVVLLSSGTLIGLK